LFTGEPTGEQLQAGSEELSIKWGGYQMLVSVAEEKKTLDAMNGYKNAVTDHSTVSVLQYMDYKNDQMNYQNKLAEIMRNKK
jgi:hypothetical protein